MVAGGCPFCCSAISSALRIGALYKRFFAGHGTPRPMPERREEALIDSLWAAPRAGGAARMAFKLNSVTKCR